MDGMMIMMKANRCFETVANRTRRCKRVFYFANTVM